MLKLCGILQLSVQFSSVQFSSVQSLSRVRLFATPWISARQASLSITISRSSLRLMSIESMMPSSHLILGCPLLLLPSIPPSIRVFSNESTLLMRSTLLVPFTSDNNFVFGFCLLLLFGVVFRIFYVICEWTILLLSSQFGYLLLLFVVWLFWLGLPVWCWIWVVRVDTLFCFWS